MTDDLIARLSADLKPVRPMAMQRLLFGAALVSTLVAIVAMNMWLGMRPDLDTAMSTMNFWTKFGYTLSVAVLGGVATMALARPDGRIRWPWIAALGLLALLVIGAFIQLATAGPDDMMPLIIGGTSLVCPWRIVVLGLPMLLASIIALRRMAPANPTLAGFAAGIMAGGAGAWVYSFACAENGMMFLALWYTLGILIVGVLGAVLGRFLLRW
ncbi:MAG: NrsF family protein [Devosia sp.]